MPTESDLYAGETVNGLAPMVFLAGAGYAVIQLIAPQNRAVAAGARRLCVPTRARPMA